MTYVADWKHLAASVIASVLIGGSGLVILTLGTRKPRKAQLLNVFS